jgi:hypothetical protein
MKETYYTFIDFIHITTYSTSEAKKNMRRYFATPSQESFNFFPLTD